jgi:hypothetical protein
MTDPGIPILLFCGPAAVPTSQAATRYYAGCVEAPIIVVRPRRLAEHDGGFPASVTFVDDEAIPGFEQVSNALRALSGQLVRSVNWYLQQYIKLAALRVVGADLVFIHDGDTVFSRRLLEEILRKPVVLCTRENVETYNALLMKAGVTPLAQSCIANGGFFSASRAPADWLSPEGFLDLVERYVIPSRSLEEISEYQMMGSILAEDLGARRISIFRRYDLLLPRTKARAEASMERALRRYDAIAIETHHHNSLLKRVAARAFYLVGASW